MTTRHWRRNEHYFFFTILEKISILHKKDSTLLFKSFCFINIRIHIFRIRIRDAKQGGCRDDLYIISHESWHKQIIFAKSWLWQNSICTRCGKQQGSLGLKMDTFIHAYSCRTKWKRKKRKYVFAMAVHSEHVFVESRSVIRVILNLIWINLWRMGRQMAILICLINML